MRYHPPEHGTVRLVDPDSIDLGLLEDTTIAVVGYGNQGRAQALNLRDSGCRVVIGQRPGPRAELAREDGFDVLSGMDAARVADVVQLLVPDHLMPKVYYEEVAPVLKEGRALAFSHGFAVHFKTITPMQGVDVYLVGPKGIGVQVRAQYEAGVGVPMLVAVEEDATGSALRLAVAHAAAVGLGRTGIYETTFRDETECDLFGEQAVLCGGIAELVRAAFEVLVEKGYPPEIAYFECLHELKLIADLLYDRGIAETFRAISPTAAFGAYTRGPRLVTDATRAELRRMVEEIQSGAFARELEEEMRTGGGLSRAHAGKAAAHPIEEAGRRIRAQFLTPPGAEAP
ncbi:MAG: ketol-acid reductoisomerase [Candidatus Sumerlaeia bacterium]|nr:ketol-acid reductoisomerase [Candidatus Sumerlaeia bacterium]